MIIVYIMAYSLSRGKYKEAVKKPANARFARTSRSVDEALRRVVAISSAAFFMNSVWNLYVLRFCTRFCNTRMIDWTNVAHRIQHHCSTRRHTHRLCYEKGRQMIPHLIGQYAAAHHTIVFLASLSASQLVVLESLLIIVRAGLAAQESDDEIVHRLMRFTQFGEFAGEQQNIGRKRKMKFTGECQVNQRNQVYVGSLG